MRELVQADIDGVNARMPRVQHVRKCLRLVKKLDDDDGEVTATMKVKRKSITEKYSDLIEEMYGARRAGQT